MTGLRITMGKPAITFPPREVVTHRIGVIARTGMGKTYAAKNLAEEFVKARLPFVVLDPLGAWWGLRLAADGEGKGLQVTILGGDYGDIPLEPTAGAEVADFVVDQPGHYVLDLSSFNSDADQDRFAEGFGLRLFRAKQPRAKRQPVMLFVDEADAFAPQQPMKGQERMLGAYRALMRRGRLFGVGMVPITQRPAALNKNVLNQAEMLIVGQVTGSQDRKALDEWIRAHATDEQRAAFLQSLAGLQKGEMWFWSPSWLRTFERVRIRKAETFDSSKTPEPNEELPEPKPLTAKAKAALEERMASTVEKAKAEDPRQLQKQIRELQAELRKKPTAASAPPPKEIVKEVLVPALTPKQLESLQGKVAELDGTLTEIRAQVERRLEAFREAAGRHLTEIIQTLQKAPIMRERPDGRASARRAEGGGSSPSSRSDGGPRAAAVPGRPATDPAVHTGGPASPPSSDVAVPRSQQRILDALAWLDSIGVGDAEKAQLAPLADQKTRSSGYRNNLSALRTAGLIHYPGPGRVALTDAGHQAANPPSAPLTTEELHDAIFQKLSGSQVRILQTLIDAYPDPLDKAELAERAEQPATSSGYRNNLSALRSMRLIEYPSPGQVAALPVLFLEEAA